MNLELLNGFIHTPPRNNRGGFYPSLYKWIEYAELFLLEKNNNLWFHLIKNE